MTSESYVFSNDRAFVYLNGILVDADPTLHIAKFWNRKVTLDYSLLLPQQVNTLAVYLENIVGGGEAFFAARLEMDKTCQPGFFPDECLSVPSTTGVPASTTGVSVTTTGISLTTTGVAASTTGSSSVSAAHVVASCWLLLVITLILSLV